MEAMHQPLDDVQSLLAACDILSGTHDQAPERDKDGNTYLSAL